MDTSRKISASMDLRMKYTRHILIVLGSLCAFVSQSHSAEAPQTFTIDFTTYALRPIDTSNIYFKSANGSLTLIQFNPKSRSSNYTATLPVESGILHFYRKHTVSDSPSITPIGHVSLTPTDTRALLIFQQGDSADDLKIHSIDDSSRNFPLGSLRVANITEVNVIGKINDSQITIKNGDASKPIQLGSNGSAEISIAAKGGERFHLLYKNRLRITSGSRGILILRPPARKGSLRIGGHLLLESPNEIKE
ncbi:MULTISPECIES: hypothetical protein [unclassified Lentimonas]|uniref:hypothetical protein n=2 Tax=Lentimonas TaxID=417293 RepID=UPI00138973FB|nr:MULTISPECIES: hypothetical protein [unclassified Lentimonas]